MWEVRTEDGWLLGIGSTIEEAENDASYYDPESPVATWESINMKNKLPLWEFN